MLCVFDLHDNLPSPFGVRLKSHTIVLISSRAKKAHRIYISRLSIKTFSPNMKIKKNTNEKRSSSHDITIHSKMLCKRDTRALVAYFEMNKRLSVFSSRKREISVRVIYHNSNAYIIDEHINMYATRA